MVPISSSGVSVLSYLASEHPGSVFLSFSHCFLFRVMQRSPQRALLILPPPPFLSLFASPVPISDPEFFFLSLYPGRQIALRLFPFQVPIFLPSPPSLQIREMILTKLFSPPLSCHLIFSLPVTWSFPPFLFSSLRIGDPTPPSHRGKSSRLIFSLISFGRSSIQLKNDPRVFAGPHSS